MQTLFTEEKNKANVFNYLSNNCEAARVNTMTGGLDLSFGFPQMVRFPTRIR